VNSSVYLSTSLWESSQDRFSCRHVRRIGTFGACLYNARQCLFLHVEEFYFLLFILILSDVGRQPAPVRSADVNYRFHSARKMSRVLNYRTTCMFRHAVVAPLLRLISGPDGAWQLKGVVNCLRLGSGRFWTMHEMAGGRSCWKLFSPTPASKHQISALPCTHI